MSEAPKKMSKKEKEAAEAARLMAERQKAAEDAFSKADVDGSGAVDKEELKKLLWGLLQHQGHKCDATIINEFVEKEFGIADKDGSGDVDFDEFIEYYNKFVDRQTGGELTAAIDDAKKAAALKAEKAAIAEDDGVYVALHTVLTMLKQPSVGEYNGFTIPFKIGDSSEYSNPKAEHGATSRGLILDLSRRAQRLLTPWGSFPIGYRLAFPGYQEKKPPEEDEGDKKKRGAKKTTPFPLVMPASDGIAEADKQSLFFDLAKLRLDADCLLVLRKLPNRCHFQVVEVLGVKQPKGEVVGISDPEAIKKLSDRWQAQRKKNPKDPRPELLGVTPQVALKCFDDQSDLVVNRLLDEAGRVMPHVAVHKEKLDILKKKKEVASKQGPKRFPEEDLHLALKAKRNDPTEAAKMLVEMARCENNTLDKRGGHSTRAGVRYALQLCNFDEEAALWYLKNSEKVVTPKLEYVSQRLGTASGLGYPTKMELESLLVVNRGEDGKVMAYLKREWKIAITFMCEILASAEVEEMLTTEQCDTFAFSRPATAEESMHVEELYLSDEFGRDKDKLVHFLTQAGTVIRRAQGTKPSRAETERLLREMNSESERVLAFLGSLDTMCDLASKQGGATREDCARHLKNCEYDEANATELLKTIWKLANPKEPKPPPKGSKKPPQPWYSQECSALSSVFPSMAECEWALLGTRKQDAPGKPLMLDKALELLKKVDSLTAECREGKYPGVVREDLVWTLEPLVKRIDLSLNRDAKKLLTGISELHQKGKESGVITGRVELLTAFEKFKFDTDKSANYLNAIGTLMSRKAELGVVSREEVEADLEKNTLDDVKVIKIFEEIAQLKAKSSEIGNASREEIKAMLSLAWGVEDRLTVTQRCLSTYRKLMQDDTQLMSLFGNGVGEPERQYLRESILRFLGDEEASLGYLKKVSEILGKGEALGWPSRELVVTTLDAHNLDLRKATAAIREEYHRVRDLQLKEEYAKNKAKQGATGGAAAE